MSSTITPEITPATSLVEPAAVLNQPDRWIDKGTDKGTEIRIKILSRQRRDHRFYLIFAILAAIAVFAGYSQSYYLKPVQSLGVLPASPQLIALVHIHAAVFSLYVLFYVAQTALISKGRRALHMTLRWASAAFIPIMVILGTMAVLYGVSMRHQQIWPDPEVAALVNVADVYLFAILATAGILLRKKPEAHRRLMLTAFVSILPAPISRLPLQPLFGPAAILIVIFSFILVGPVYDLVTRRRIHAAYVLSLILIVPTGPPLRVALGKTQAWHHFIDKAAAKQATLFGRY